MSNESKMLEKIEKGFADIQELQKTFFELKCLLLNDNDNYKNPFESVFWTQNLREIIEKMPIMQCINFNTDYYGRIRNQGDCCGEIVLTEKKFFAFKVDDVEKVQANQALIEASLQNARNAIEEVMIEYIFKLVDSNSNIHTIKKKQLNKDNIYGYFVELAYSLLNSLSLLHDINDFNIFNGEHLRPFVIIHPVIESILLQSPEFVTYYNISDKTLREGSIGRIANMDVIVNYSVSQNEILAGLNGAIDFVSDCVKMESLRDKDSFSDLVRGLYLYGAKIVKPECLAKMVITENVSGVKE